MPQPAARVQAATERLGDGAPTRPELQAQPAGLDIGSTVALSGSTVALSHDLPGETTRYDPELARDRKHKIDEYRAAAAILPDAR